MTLSGRPKRRRVSPAQCQARPRSLLSDPSPLLDQNFRECAWAFAAQDPVTGDIMCRTSGSIDPQHHHIIFGDFRSKLEQAVKLSGVERSCEVIDVLARLSSNEIGRMGPQQEYSYARRSSIKSESEHEARSRPATARSLKRRHSSIRSSRGPCMRGPDPITPPQDECQIAYTIERIKISDTLALEAFYRRGLMDMQQVNCKSIAKVWIKVIEEKKQIHHPYNGGRQGGKWDGDSELSKPPWWPGPVQHKEPDHLKKPGRIDLLLHLLTGLFDPSWGEYRVTADKLDGALSCLSNNKNLRAKGAWEIIKEILRVRRLQERFLAGEIDGDSYVTVRTREPRMRSRSPDDGDSEEEAETITTPRTARAQSPAPQFPTDGSQRFQLMHDQGQSHIYSSASSATYAQPMPTTTHYDSLAGRCDSAPCDSHSIASSQAYTAGPADVGTSGFAVPNWGSFATSQRQQQPETLSPSQHSTSYSPWTPVDPGSSFGSSPYIEDPSQSRISHHIMPEPMSYDAPVQVQCDTPMYTAHHGLPTEVHSAGLPHHGLPTEIHNAGVPHHSLPTQVHNAGLPHYGQTAPTYHPFRNASIDQTYSPMIPRQDGSMPWPPS